VLVRAAELFGIAEGTTRVALSRMVTAGELEARNGRYRLTGRLAERQVRQSESRAATTRRWDGTWELAVVRPDPRPAPDRTALREATQQLRMAELREGVWVRPDNLDRRRLPEARAIVESQCTTWRAGTIESSDDPAELARRLWGLEAWAADAIPLADDMASTLPSLEAHRTSALAPGFLLSAAVLRHLQHDPLLPGPLLPPDWPGTSLRTTYSQYDAAYRAVLRGWLRGH
jgi:phenylacetic acid degradation operon negative regulatory protein